MDPDMNKYDVEHVVTAHPKMTADEWMGAYQAAWGTYYTDDHLETIVRRAYSSGVNIRSLMPVLFWFSSAVPVEGVHPLQWGIFRIKHRRDRRPGLPIEWALSFYARYTADIARKVLKVVKRWRHLKQIVLKVEADPLAKLYTDEALMPVAEEDAAHMELYTQNEAARAAVEREHRVTGHHIASHRAYGRQANGHHGNGHTASADDHHGRDELQTAPPVI
jgi:hypothetical protein